MPAVKEEKGTSTDHVIAGVASRCVTEAFMSPFNLVKVRLQNNPDLARGYGSISEAFYHVTREEGLYGIYRGLPPRLLWTAPLAAFTFLFYEEGKKLLEPPAGQAGPRKLHIFGRTFDSPFGNANPYVAVISPFALVAGVGIRTPFDIVEQRLQLANLQKGAGGGSGGPKAAESVTTQSIFRDVVKAEGYRGLMKGFAPSLLLHAMFLGGYFVVYEGSKRAMLSTSETLSERPFIAHILGGALAGSVVAGVTTPMDYLLSTLHYQNTFCNKVLKTRMQVTPMTADGKYPTVTGTIAEARKSAGVRAFWRGFGPRAASYAPAGAITFFTYEAIKSISIRFRGDGRVEAGGV